MKFIIIFNNTEYNLLSFWLLAGWGFPLSPAALGWVLIESCGPAGPDELLCPLSDCPVPPLNWEWPLIGPERDVCWNIPVSFGVMKCEAYHSILRIIRRPPECSICRSWSSSCPNHYSERGYWYQSYLGWGRLELAAIGIKPCLLGIVLFFSLILIICR